MKLQRTYLSREMTRAMALDHPIGDPFGGVAYGERNGPVIAIAAAAISIEVGITMLATNVLVGGLMIAGGVLSGLGAITGNETLSTLGMVAGLAGGIGGATGLFDSFGAIGGAEGFSKIAGEAFGDGKGISGMFGMGGETGAISIPEGSSFAAESANMATGPQAAAIEATQPSAIATGVTPEAPYGDFYKTGNLGSGLYDDAINGATMGGGTGLDLAAVGPGKNLSTGLFGGMSDMTKYGMINAGSDFMKSLSTAPTEEQADQNSALMDAKIAETQANTSLTQTKKDQMIYELELAKQKVANKQFTNFSNMIPTASATPYSGTTRAYGTSTTNQQVK